MSEAIAPNKVVAINYTVKTAEGQTLEQSSDFHPRPWHADSRFGKRIRRQKRG